MTQNLLTSLRRKYANSLPSRDLMVLTHQLSVVQVLRLFRQHQLMMSGQRRFSSLLTHSTTTSHSQFVTSTSHSLCRLKTFSQSKDVEPLLLVVSSAEPSR